MIMEKSGEERLMMGFSMFDMAPMAGEGGARANKPEPARKEIRRERFP